MTVCAPLRRSVGFSGWGESSIHRRFLRGEREFIFGVWSLNGTTTVNTPSWDDGIFERRSLTRKEKLVVERPQAHHLQFAIPLSVKAYNRILTKRFKECNFYNKVCVVYSKVTFHISPKLQKRAEMIDALRVDCMRSAEKGCRISGWEKSSIHRRFLRGESEFIFVVRSSNGTTTANASSWDDGIFERKQSLVAFLRLSREQDHKCAVI